MSTSITGTEDATKKNSNYSPNYYQRNKDVIDAANRAWREANPEKVREIQRAWREANEGHTYGDAGGYVKYIGFKHPATNASGVTAYHRIVLWEKLDGQDAPCNWCDKHLFWDSLDHEDRLIVDHVNTVKHDNDPENLVPSCHRCNVSRPGGQNRKGATITGQCDFEGCENDAKVNNKTKTMVLCAGHWQQEHAGKALRPLRTKKILHKDANGRICTECEKYKTWDNYGRTSKGSLRAKCNSCLVIITRAARDRRLAANVPCSDKGCDNPADVKGLCSVHYHREWTKAGDAK